MIDIILLYTGAIIITLWGIAHIFPTKSIVNNFGSLSEDNRKIIIMEWIAEGLTLCFIGLLVIGVTHWGTFLDSTSIIVYRVSSIMLFLLAGLSLFTGARTSIVPMKICPFVKMMVAVLFFLGSIDW